MDGKMIKCPCKECITYAMCRVQVRGMINPNVSQLSIKKDCELLLNYLRITKDHICENGNETFIDVARRQFGLSGLWGPPDEKY
jgi:hypothetical protein